MKNLLLLIFLSASLLLKAQIPTDGLMAYYPFNNNALDESGNAKNGTVSGASLTTDRFNILNSAYSFTTSSKITIPSFAFTKPTLSISFWFNTTTLNNARPLGHNWGTGTVQPYLDNNCLCVAYKTSGSDLNHQSTTTLSTNTWYHGVVVNNGDSSLIYINGQLSSKIASIGTLSPKTTSFVIGDNRSGFFSGKVDDIRIYDRALSSNEVDLLYNEIPANVIIADFESNKTLLKIGENNILTDLSISASEITSWQWTISGAALFSSTLQNPSFIFDTAGKYDVKLVISDGTLKDSITKVSYLTVAAESQIDSLFFAQKKELLTAKYDAPFDKAEVITNHAPKGPYMGNGDVGVATHTTNSSQTFQISKVDFQTDNWSDWAGIGPAAITLGGVSIQQGVNTNVNLALNKVVAVSSFYSANESADKALDGLTNTKWCTAPSNVNTNKWITIDLGSVKDISRWVVKHAEAGGEAAYYNTSDFKLQKSSDNSTWVDVDAVVNNTSSFTDRNVTTFSSRYIRLFVTKAEQGANNYARIYEIELYQNPTTTGAGTFSYEMDQLGNELRMTTGVSDAVSMKSWMSVDDNFIITELKTNSTTPIDMAVETFVDSTSTRYATASAVTGSVAQVSRETYTSGVRWVSKAGISTKILGVASSLRAVSNSKTQTTFSLSNSQPVYVISFVSGGGVQNDAKLPEALSRVDAITTDSISVFEETKAAWWKDMWTRSYVETNDDLLNRHYLSSIYLLASGYNEHSSVCGGMYGVWNLSDNMMYHGDIHLNYNSQAGFYSVFSANRPEIAKPFYSYIESLIPEGRLNAQNDMGSLNSSWSGKSCRGILYKVSGLGLGYMYGSYWNQTVDAPYNVPLFSWYYEYTGDLDFLENRAYPFIKECGDFYEDFMKKENYGNSYRYTVTAAENESGWDLNGAAYLGNIRQIYTLLLKYSKVLNVDAERRALWQDILSHLSGYTLIASPTDGKPIIAATEAGDNRPGHAITLEGVYPFESMTNNPDTLQAAYNTLYHYCIQKNAFTGVMNSLGHADHTIAAILGMDPDIIVGSLKSLISTAKPNFLIVDGHHMAEKTAAIEAINTMMLRSIDSCLYLFPNWIAKAASFTRLRTKGAFLVSADYDGSKVTNLKIVSDKGTLCKIKNPWAGTSMIVMETLDGLTAPVECTIENDIYSFPTKAGASYTFDIQTSVPNVIHEKSTFTVFPNPVSNTVRVVLNNKCGDNSSFVNVYAVNGTKCLSQKLERGISDILMDVSDLGNGFYFVNYKESSEKLIIRK